MKTHRVWFEIVILGTGIACALALLLATFAAVADAAASQVQRQQASRSTQRAFEGMVTCSRCGARHSAARGQAADACVRVCVHDGGSFALVDSDSTYTLEGDLVVLKKFAGQRVRVVGTLVGRTIKVASLSSES